MDIRLLIRKNNVRHCERRAVWHSPGQKRYPTRKCTRTNPVCNLRKRHPRNPSVKVTNAALADDLKMYQCIVNPANCRSLQMDIDRLCAWCNMWLLGPNAEKCKIMHLGQNNPRHNYTMILDGQSTNLSKSESEKDLGVYVEPSLNFNKHCNETTRKCTKILWSIKRTIDHLELEMSSRNYTLP